MVSWTKISLIIYLLLAFAIGFAANKATHYFQTIKNENSLTGFSVSEPSDYLNSDNVLIYPDKVVLKVSGASLSDYDSTGSMMPLLWEGANGIIVKPENENDIQVGDIISFKQNGRIIVHRVVSIEFDVEGVYFTTKGDSNPREDDWRVRFGDIEGKLIGVLY